MKTLAPSLLLLAVAACALPDEVTVFGSHTESDSISGTFGGKYGASSSISGGGDSDTIGVALTYYVGWGRRGVARGRVNAGYFDLPPDYAVHPVADRHDDGGHADILGALDEDDEDWIEQAKRAGEVAGGMPWGTIARIGALVLILGGAATVAWMWRNKTGFFTPRDPKP